MSDHDEWTAAVADMTEVERAVTAYEVRRADGICGDRDDAGATSPRTHHQPSRRHE